MSTPTRPTPLRIGVAGCTGRMGRVLLRLIAAADDLTLAAALTTADDPLVGQSVRALIDGDFHDDDATIAADTDAKPDVLIEFTLPTGARQWLEWCRARRIPLISGTTGLTDADFAALRDAAGEIPILHAPNMSIGVNLLLRLVGQVAAMLDESWDIEIVESHHRHKVDAPSGTAEALLRAAADARMRDATKSGTRDAADMAVYGRHGKPGERPAGEIGVHAVRMGGLVGEHCVHFASDNEQLTLTHRAASRDIFAHGALAAARWIVTQPAGLYGMADVLER